MRANLRAQLGSENLPALAAERVGASRQQGNGANKGSVRLIDLLA